MIKFLPLLGLYIIVVLIFYGKKPWGDETRYLAYTYNLYKGYFVSNNAINLWNGPGYPIILTPFMLLHLPWLAAKLMNAAFMFLAVLFFYYTMRFYMAEQRAVLVSYIIGLYPPFLRFLHVLMTETFVILLVCAFLFYFCKIHQDKEIKWGPLLTSAGFLGYLALTKIFFGYVILVGLVVAATLYFINNKSSCKKTFFVYLVAIIICMPYLFYTHSLTGKIFYWGSSGGMSLYWMSSPYPNDLGDWFDYKDVMGRRELSRNHAKFFTEIKDLSITERDDRFKKRAVENIIDNPLKFFKNWLANIGRLLFNYPYSYSPQKMSTYFYIVPNMFLIVFLVLSFCLAYIRRKLIPHEIFALLLFGIFSFLGGSLLSAYNRMFTPLVPVFILWISFVLIRVVRVEIQQ